jgi:hypothetical protein
LNAAHVEAAAGVEARSEPRRTQIDLQARYCIREDQLALLPQRVRAPAVLPSELPLPRVGDVVALTPRSLWAVYLVKHQWHSPRQLVIEVWLEATDDNGAAGTAQKERLH